MSSASASPTLTALTLKAGLHPASRKALTCGVDVPVDTLVDIDRCPDGHPSTLGTVGWAPTRAWGEPLRDPGAAPARRTRVNTGERSGRSWVFPESHPDTFEPLRRMWRQRSKPRSIRKLKPPWVLAGALRCSLFLTYHLDNGVGPVSVLRLVRSARWD